MLFRSKVGRLGPWPQSPSLGAPNPEEMTKNVTAATDSFNSAGISGAQNSMIANKEDIKDKIIIPFFYLGDLLQAVLEGMFNGESPGVRHFFDKQLKVLLGPIIFYDYGKLTDKISLKAGSQTNILPDGTKIQGKIYTGEKTVVNIADIPISLDTYTAWFTKKIVDAGVSSMSFRDFVNIILNDLVIRAVGAETYSFAPRQKTRLVYKTKTVRRDPKRFFNNSSTTSSDGKSASMGQAAGTGELKYPSTLVFQASSLSFYEDRTVVEETTIPEHFVLIYSVSDQQFELRSDYETDKKRGIRHIVYGAETGLIKNIKFTRQDNPLIRSHNMRMASQQNSDKSIILREVYNANVEMFGNSLFEIGELIRSEEHTSELQSH